MAATWIKCGLSFRLLGPVFRYDLVRGTRRGRLALLRCLYGIALLAAVLGGAALWLMTQHRPANDLFFLQFHTANEASQFAGWFFYGFLALQWLMVLLLTPAYVAGALTEEKERRTLEYLLTTDLRNREIVFGLLASRLAHMILLLLIGVPVLALLFLLGGVDPQVLLAGVAACALTMFSLSGLSVLHSVYARQAWVAVLRTYLTAGGYLGFTAACRYVLVQFPTLRTLTLGGGGAAPITPEDVAYWLNIGNLPMIVESILLYVGAGKSLYALMPGYLFRYAVFHLAVGLACCTWAALAVRSRARREAAGFKKRERKPSPRPPVGNWPLFWKEWFLEGGRRRGWVWKLGAGVVLAAMFWPAVQIVYFFGHLSGTGPDRGIGLCMNGWILWVLGLCGYFMLLQVILRAAGSFSGERQRHTLDLILLTPMTNRSILLSKWLGCLFAGRWLWLWLAVAATLAMIAGGLNPFAALVWLGMWLLCAGFLAAVAMWFSLTARTTVRAMLATLAALAVGMLIFWVALDQLDRHVLRQTGDPARLPELADILTGSWISLDKQLGFFEVVPLLLGFADVVFAWMVSNRFRRLTHRESGGPPRSLSKWDGVPWPTRVIAWCRWGRQRLAAATLTLVPLFILMIVYACRNESAERELQATLAAAERVDPHWRLQESDQGVASFQRILKAATDLGCEVRLYPWQTPSALSIRVPLKALERRLAQTGADDASLATVQRVLEEEEGLLSLLSRVRTERIEWLRPFDGKKEEIIEWQLARNRDLVFVGSIKDHQRDLLDFLNSLSEIARLPVEQQSAEAARLKSTLPVPSPLVQSVGFRLCNEVSVNVFVSARLRCAVVMVALERYRQRHNGWPEQLTDLVPELVVRVPVDPYDGLPLHYRQFSDGVVVYSIGADGKDDSGNVLHDADIGFRLWNVDRRRQPQK